MKAKMNDPLNIEPPKWIRIPGLYQLVLTVDNFPALNTTWDNVTITIFRWNTGDVPFIPRNYLSNDVFKKCAANILTVEEHLKEHFLPDELKQIKNYLKERKKTTIEEHYCSIPEDGNVMPTGCIPVGGGTDFYQFFKEDGYDLPFKIAGYYDLREHTGAKRKG